MDRRPVRQQDALVSLPVIGLEVGAARFAVIDAQPAFSLDAEARQAVRFRLAEGTCRSRVFLLVTISCLPAAAPFVIFSNPMLALRVSNVLLIAMLFWVGQRWAYHIHANRLLVGLALVAVGLALVGVAVLLGG